MPESWKSTGSYATLNDIFIGAAKRDHDLLTVNHAKSKQASRRQARWNLRVMFAVATSRGDRSPCCPARWESQKYLAFRLFPRPSRIHHVEHACSDQAFARHWFPVIMMFFPTYQSVDRSITKACFLLV